MIVRLVEAISIIPVRSAANDFSIRWYERDADVLPVLQGAFVPSGREIIASAMQQLGVMAHFPDWCVARNGVGVHFPDCLPAGNG
jgi:hypothetical protein